MSIENWLSPDQASKIIGCTADHVRLLARNGDITAEKLGPRTWLIDRKSAEKLAKKPQQTGRPRKNQK